MKFQKIAPELLLEAKKICLKQNVNQSREISYLIDLLKYLPKLNAFLGLDESMYLIARPSHVSEDIWEKYVLSYVIKMTSFFEIFFKEYLTFTFDKRLMFFDENTGFVNYNFENNDSLVINIEGRDFLLKIEEISLFINGIISKSILVHYQNASDNLDGINKEASFYLYIVSLRNSFLFDKNSKFKAIEKGVLISLLSTLTKKK